MKPVEHGFKHYWIKATSFQSLGMDGFRYTDCEISIDPNCMNNYDDFKNAFHVVEHSALVAEKQKVCELVEALKEALTYAQEFNDGCLYCGCNLDDKYDQEGNETESHKNECYYSRCKSLIDKYTADQVSKEG